MSVASALRYLVRSFFCDATGRPRLVLAGREARWYVNGLMRVSSTLRPSSPRKLLVLAMLYYYAWGSNRREAVGFAKKVALCRAPGARLVAKSLASVGGRLAVAETVGAVWRSVFPLR